MLTKADFSQIRKIIREEIEVESKTSQTDIEYEIQRMRIELSLRLDKIEDNLKNLNIRTSRLELDSKKILKTLTQIKKDINSLGRYGDENHMRLRKRIEQLEDQVRIQSQ